MAVKNVTLAEDHLHDHFPGFPLMPQSLLIEGMAQTAGILVGEAKQFAEKVILAKIRRATFDGLARPGDQLRFEAEIEQIDERGAMTTGRIRCGETRIGEVDLAFSHIDQNMRGLNFPAENFVFTEDFKALLKMYREHGAENMKL